MPRQVHRVIVEGMDGTGKTTLIDNLTQAIPNLIVVVNKKTHEQDFNTWWPLVLEREQDGFTPIYDRFYYSELVYGPIIRGHINANPILVQNVLWFLRAGSLLIYARPHTDELKETIKVNEQMEGVHDKFNELLEFYDQLMSAEQSFFNNRFTQYVWHREGELERMTELVRAYMSGEMG